MIPLLFQVSIATYAYLGDALIDGDTEKGKELCLVSLALAMACLHAMHQDMFLPLAVGFLPMYGPIKTHTLLKTVYVACLWTLCLDVVPMLYHSSFDPWPCLHTFGIVGAISNEADIPDMKQDIKNGVLTVPATYGLTAARVYTGAFLALGVMGFSQSPTLGKAALSVGGFMRPSPKRRTTTRAYASARRGILSR
jgi:4-hydroxybenzoate polyprenyltransferase